MVKITYVTPTYNRAHLLPRLYQSLCSQTNKHFIWLIIDDGSTDGTGELVQKWINEGNANIQYIYKENGGKNTAMEMAHQKCSTDFLCIVDSDDYLSRDATEVIYNKLDLCNSDKIVGIVGRRAKPDGSPFNTNWCEDDQEICFYDLQSKFGYAEDTVLVFKTNVIKQFHFPSIPDERFITESVFYQQFLYDYKMIAMPECIYLAEYQTDGYTSQGLKLFFRNPKGFLYALKQNAYYNIQQGKPFASRVKSATGYYAWKKVLKVEEIDNNYKIKFIYRFLGNALKLVVLNKYKKKYMEFKENN